MRLIVPTLPVVRTEPVDRFVRNSIGVRHLELVRRVRGLLAKGQFGTTTEDTEGTEAKRGCADTPDALTD